MANNEHSPQWLSNFITIYQGLNTDNVNDICNIYHDDIVFEDPIHKVEGLDNLLGYFNNLYQNLSFCEFTINDYFYKDNKAAVYWAMSFQHEKLNGGKKVNVIGHTHVR